MSRLPARLWRTWECRAPLATHFRPATCAEVDCPMWRDGWSVTLDLTSDAGHEAMAAIREAYRFGEYVVLDSPVSATLLHFSPGLDCFARTEHRLRLDRPPLYVVRDGDHGRTVPGDQPLVLPDGDAWCGTYNDHHDRVYAG